MLPSRHPIRTHAEDRQRRVSESQIHEAQDVPRKCSNRIKRDEELQNGMNTYSVWG
jgi:hypothetical protein